MHTDFAIFHSCCSEGCCCLEPPIRCNFYTLRLSLMLNPFVGKCMCRGRSCCLEKKFFFRKVSPFTRKKIEVYAGSSRGKKQKKIMHLLIGFLEHKHTSRAITRCKVAISRPATPIKNGCLVYFIKYICKVVATTGGFWVECF